MVWEVSLSRADDRVCTTVVPLDIDFGGCWKLRIPESLLGRRKGRGARPSPGESVS